VIGTAHDLRSKATDSEKITINLGCVDRGHIDLMVQAGLGTILLLFFFLVLACHLRYRLQVDLFHLRANLATVHRIASGVASSPLSFRIRHPATLNQRPESFSGVHLSSATVRV
jgi:Ribbon-Helix-Helix transcriptional regulator family